MKDPIEPAGEPPSTSDATRGRAGRPFSTRGVGVLAVLAVLVVGAVATFAFGRGRSPITETPAPGSGRSTEDILRELGPDCLPCAQRSGCLDPGQLGGTCEGTKGNATECGSGVTETAICLKTLDDTFRSKCAADMQMTPCFCGSTDPAACLSGAAAPTGPILSDYTCDFKTTNAMKLQADFTDQRLGAGQANALVQCLGAFTCGCFGSRDN